MPSPRQQHGGGIPIYCRCRCCDVVLSDPADNGSDGEGDDIYENWWMVEDHKPYDDHNVLIATYDGDVFNCQKDCIEEKVNRVCKKCVVDNGGDVFCDEGEIPFSCINRCCNKMIDSCGDICQTVGELTGN